VPIGVDNWFLQNLKPVRKRGRCVSETVRYLNIQAISKVTMGLQVQGKNDITGTDNEKM
jgi:hypothetical protein